MGVVERARNEAADALARTPEMLPVLAQAGVVDAGGTGYLLLLDAFLLVLDGRPLPEPSGVDAPDLSGLNGVAGRGTTAPTARSTPSGTCATRSCTSSRARRLH